MFQKYEKGEDHLAPADGIDPPVEAPKYAYRYTNWTYIYSPLCGSVSWGQETPFNDKAPLRGGKHAYAGCVATAVAQFFRTAQYPAWYNGQYLDWDFFTRYSENETHTVKEKETFDDQVSRLFRSIGDALDNDWGKDATGANFKDVPSLLRKAGFQNVPAITDYNYGTVSKIVFTVGGRFLCAGVMKNGRLRYLAYPFIREDMFGYVMVIWYDIDF